MVRKQLKPIFFALLAAIFYAINVPFSKQLLQDVPPTFMASFLYFGAGIGVGILYLFHWKNEKPEERLKKENFPYTIGMILLDIFAPIFLMFGISIGSSANASLLSNFEIVATTLIALLLFKENVSRRLWLLSVLSLFQALFYLLKAVEASIFLLAHSSFSLQQSAGEWKITAQERFLIKALIRL